MLNTIKTIILVLNIIFSVAIAILFTRIKKLTKQDQKTSEDGTKIHINWKKYSTFLYCYVAFLFANIVIQIVEFVLNFV